MNTWVLVFMLSHGLALCFGTSIQKNSNKLSNMISEESSYVHNGTNFESDVGNNKIINGVAAAQGDAPWQVHLTLKKGTTTTYCGGILLSKRVVVTAAHCIQGIADKDIKIGMGALDRTKFPAQYKFTAQQSFIHENYAGCINTPGSPMDCSNDIALIILNGDAVLSTGANPMVQIANLPPYLESDTVYKDKDARISGWGVIKDGGTTRPTQLKKAEVTVWDQADCSNVYAPPYNIYDQLLMMCAGWSNNNGASPCQMDSGGPLVNVDNNANVLWGIISNGADCTQFPFVYTRVTYYVNWIKDKAQAGGYPITR